MKIFEMTLKNFNMDITPKGTLGFYFYLQILD